MPRNESGQYVKPPGTTAVPNTTIASAPYNALQDDMADALTESLPRTGVAPMLADLPMNGNKITGLEDGAGAGDAVNFGQLDAKLNKDGSNVAANGAALRAAQDVDYTFHDIAIGGLSSGVLTIPREGTYFNLTGHGSADFTIEEFGDERPVGKAFHLLVPRTIGVTGGTSYSRGNKVSFIHTAIGAGLDLTMNRRIIDGSPVYTYIAYPDACDSGGNSAALYELLMFVPLGGGRHELRRLPDPATGQGANGNWRIFNNGTLEVWTSVSVTPTPNAYTSETWDFPVSFLSETYSIQVSASSSANTTKNVQFSDPSSTSVEIGIVRENNVTTSIRAFGLGLWK